MQVLMVNLDGAQTDTKAVLLLPHISTSLSCLLPNQKRGKGSELLPRSHGDVAAGRRSRPLS